MSQTASLQTEIVIIDKASHAFESIEKSINRASESLDRFQKKADLVKQPRITQPVMPELDNVGRSMSTVGDIAQTTGRQCEAAFNGMGSVMGQNTVQMSQLTGGFLGFAAKAAPAIYAVENALNLVKTAAEKAFQVIGRGDNIAKTSRALHIDAQSFQELDYAIQRGGGSSQDFELGLRTLNRQISELKKGSSGARQAFGRLGLSLEDVNNLGLEGTLYAVSNALHGMENAEDVDDVMQTLFGRGGFKLASAFSVGSDALDELRKQAQATGTIMDDDALALTEKGADRLLDATLSIQSVWQNISAEIMPTVVNGLELVSQFFKNHQESISKIEKLVGRTIGAALDGIFTIADNLATITDAVLTPLADIGNGIFDAFGSIFDTITTAGGALSDKRNKQVEELNTKHFGLIERYIQDVVTEVGYVGKDIQEANKKYDVLVKQTLAKTAPKTIDDYENEVLDAALKNNRLELAKANAMASMGDDWENADTMTQIERVREYYDAMDDVVINSAEDLRTFKESVEQGEIEMEALGRVIDETSNNIARRGEAIKALNNQIALTRSEAGIGKGERNSRISQYEKRLKRLEALQDNDKTERQRAIERTNELGPDLEKKQDAIANAMATIVNKTTNIDKNTRSVRINKDSILFMKEMATAEIINKYNEISNTVNTTFNSNEKYSRREVEQLNGAMIDRALGASSV